ncbi:MAG: helicase-associated domain-containing protein [Candidatus Pristimantibacillus sp.]
MYVTELAQKFTEEKQAQFMKQHVWISAASHGLPWSRAIVDKHYVQEAVKALSSSAGAALRAIYIRCGAAPVHEERLLSIGSRQTGLSGAEFRCGLIELQNAGILIAVRKAWGERIFFVPRDCFILWQQCLFISNIQPQSDSKCNQLEMMEAPCKPLGRQLLTALAELSRCGLELTVKGLLPKRTITKVTQAFELKDQQLSALRLTNAYKEQYPLSLSFLLEISLRLELFIQEERQLEWQKDKLTAWLKLPVSLREAMLHEWCVSELLNASPSMANSAALLSGLEAGKWYAEASVKEQMKQFGMMDSDEHEGVEQYDWWDWLQVLQAFGWIERAQTPDGMLLRWSIDPEWMHRYDLHPEPIMIEPNGEVVVMPYCDFRIRWELELLAERMMDDRMTVYRLNARDCARALQHGRTQASIHHFLMEASGGNELPFSVVTSLDDWVKRAGRMTNPDALSSVKSRYPLILLTEEGAIEQSGQSEHSNERNSLFGPFAGMLIDEQSQWLYRYPLINDDGVTMKDLFPEMELVPINWLKQLRVYHHSTRREMLEQALSWQTPVQLRMEDGILSFVPFKLEAAGQGWAVVGTLREEQIQREVRLTPDMWEEMKLVVPEMNGIV